jgi:hypothetical protein
MHEGKRPGGLTALAVFNFIGAGVDCLGLLSVLAMIVFGGELAKLAEEGFRKQAEARAEEEGRDPAGAEITEEEKKAVAILRSYEKGAHVVAQAAGLAVCAALLLAAGVGYLRQRRWGRILGNLYVLASAAASIHVMQSVPQEYGGGFKFVALLSFVYPALTLYLLNLTFREDLAR